MGHLLSGSTLNHLMHLKDAECILIFLSAMPRGVSVACIYKGLTSWFSFVVSDCEFVTFPLVSSVRCGT